MLQFFRKYQRVFFLIVTFVIIISFSFFGTHSYFPNNKQADKKVSETISGKPITARQIQTLAHFLDAKYDDEQNPNLFNDDVLGKDILQTSIGLTLVKAYFEDLKEDLEKSYEKAKKFRPYVHPKFPFLSAENIWTQFAPMINEHYQDLRNLEEFSYSAFEKMTDLYLEESKFPSYFLKSILLHTQQKQSWIEVDPTLSQRDLSLFGFRQPSDWFGKRFLELAAQFILNVSSLSEKKGYKITFEEAKMDLHKNFLTSLNKRGEDKKSPLQPLFIRQLQKLNMTEKEAILLWQNVSSFRKYFQTLSQSLLMDHEIWPFREEKVTMHCYSLPSHLQFSSFEDVLKLDMYIQAVSDKEKHSNLLLPTVYLSAEQVKEKFPELVEKRFSLAVREVSKERLKTKVALKDIWEWQLDESNWERLRQKFSFLDIEISTRQARFDHIKNLEKQQQQIIDEFAIEEILRETPQITIQMLEDTPEKEMILGICKEEITENLQGISDVQKLKRHLLSHRDLQDSFSGIYSDNGKAFYQFKVLEVFPDEQIMSFERALDTKKIDRVLQRYLEEKYPKIRESEPTRFKEENGEYKPFALVLEEVGLLVFEDQYTSLEKQCGKYQKKGQNPLQFYMTCRLIPHLQQIYRNRENLAAYFSQKQDDPLVSQWRLQEKEVSLHSKEEQDPFLRCAFDVEEGHFSDIGISEKRPMFFKVTQKITQIDQEAIQEKRKAMCRELSKDLADRIILQMQSQDVICFLEE